MWTCKLQVVTLCFFYLELARAALSGYGEYANEYVQLNDEITNASIPQFSLYRVVLTILYNENCESQLVTNSYKLVGIAQGLVKRCKVPSTGLVLNPTIIFL